jgi:hypothetical protein
LKKALLWIFRPSILSAAIFAFFFIPYCGFLFGCGCVQLWAGAHHACNAFHAGPPDCPFCVPPFCKNCGATAQSILQVIPFVAAYLPAAITVQLLKRWKGRNYARDVVIGILMMAVSLLIVAFFYGKAANYPYFLPSLR